MTVPVLQAGDQIHIISEMMPDSLVNQIQQTYRDSDIKVIGWTELPSVSGLRIVSIVRATPKPTPGQMMTGFMPGHPPGAR